jgi:hypothetical protein
MLTLAEFGEVGASVPLVRNAKIGSIHVGTAALGCPAEKNSARSLAISTSRILASSSLSMAKVGRAALDRTAEGGCPHVAISTGQHERDARAYTISPVYNHYLPG